VKSLYFLRIEVGMSGMILREGNIDKLKRKKRRNTLLFDSLLTTSSANKNTISRYKVKLGHIL
jgi:hypothetical protein